MKRKEIYLIAVCLIIAVGILIVQRKQEYTNKKVIIEVGGKFYNEYKIEEEQVIVIEDTNEVAIEEGFVFMKSSTCRDQICVNQGKIYEGYETIICLPNQVVIRIEAD
ncbi:MAG: NusG domain II-containing protein [Lachnospiraceae bacterium]